jgi:NDP-sugar pyrophosphorylase family protein
MKYAVILAGGRGTRLRPYTLTLPKPLVPLVDTPIVEIMIRKLANAGYEEVTLAINHMGELIKAYFGNGEKWGVTARYSLEDEPLGTIAPLRLIPDLPENFLVVNADVLSDLDLSKFLEDHIQSGAIFTIAATSRDQVLDFGVLGTEEGRLVSFREKPKISQTVSMGIYAVNRRVLEYIPPKGPFGFDQLMLKLIATDQVVNVVEHTGYWLDIGRPEDYEQANREFEKDRSRFL